MIDKPRGCCTVGMTSNDQSSPESSRQLRDLFIDITGEVEITDQQDGDEETDKKILDRADSESPKT